MFRRVWLTLVVMMLSGCRIVSQQKLVPQILAEAKPLATLITSLQSAKDFDSACQTYGYRSQAENPWLFSVSVRGNVTAVNIPSRSGK